MIKTEVSVIIPIYGVEKYIRKCLESVLNQTLKEIEIIIINDGTKDNSMQIVEEYINDERIKIINKENGGISSARNVGLKKAQGKYIVFIDSDDFIKSEMLEELFLEAERGNYEIVYSNVILYNNKTKKLKNRDRNTLKIESEKGSYHYRFCGMEVWNKIYKREFLLKNNILFRENIIHEDNLFTLKCFFLAKKVKYINKYHYFYRAKRENSYLNSKKNILEEKKYFEIILKEIDKFKNNYENEVFDKLRLELNYLDHKTLLYKTDYNSNNLLSKEEIQEIKEKVKKEWSKFKNLEKEILKIDFINLLESKAVYSINFFDSFYWKNKLITVKSIRRIMKTRIKNKHFQRNDS